MNCHNVCWFHFLSKCQGCNHLRQSATIHWNFRVLITSYGHWRRTSSIVRTFFTSIQFNIVSQGHWAFAQFTRAQILRLLQISLLLSYVQQPFSEAENKGQVEHSIPSFATRRSFSVIFSSRIPSFIELFLIFMRLSSSHTLQSLRHTHTVRKRGGRPDRWAKIISLAFSC